MLGRATVRHAVRPCLRRGYTQSVADPATWNQAPVLVTTLPNGVRVASKQTFGETCSVGVFLDAGARSESQHTAGASYVMEQLALAGTKRRPKDKFEKELASMGAVLDVASGREQTSFMVSTVKENLKQSVDIVADLVTGPGVGNIKREIDGIARNLEEVDKSTRAVLDDRLHACAFRDCSLGNSSIGPFEGIGKMGEDALADFVASNYTAERVVLAAAGPSDHAGLVALASDALGGLKAGKPVSHVEKPYFCGADLLYRNDEMGATAYVSIGWEGVPHKSPDAVTFMVMQQIIGSYAKGSGLVPGTISGNRTINNIANKMQVGCADNFEAFNVSYKDTGMFGFYAACDEVAVEHCVGELMFGVNLLSYSVTGEEVARAKRELKAKLCFSDAASAQCAEMGRQVIAYGRGVPLAEMMVRIDAVDEEEVKRVAYKYLNDNEVAATALGPIHGFPMYMDLRRMTTMHRY